MTTADRLRLHLADKGATWQEGATGACAAWTGPEGPCAVALLPQPLTAAAIVDAYVGRPAGARLTLVHDGPVSPVALRSAARFGIALLDAATLPALPLPEPVAAPSAPAPSAAPALLFEAPALVVELALPAHEAPPLLAAPEPAPRLTGPQTTPLLPSHEEVSMEGPTERVAEVAPAVPSPAPATAEAVVTFTAPAAAPALVIEGALPWDPAVPVAEAARSIEVTAGELAALPWHDHAPIEEHVEVMSGSPRSRRHVERPTVAGALDWGLPWPRPVPATDGLSIADPRIWNAQERMHAVREDLEAARGASSFGAVKPEGSPWLKRVQGFGAP
jgi:hypothetical protein